MRYMPVFNSFQAEPCYWPIMENVWAVDNWQQSLKTDIVKGCGDASGVYYNHLKWLTPHSWWYLAGGPHLENVTIKKSYEERKLKRCITSACQKYKLKKYPPDFSRTVIFTKKTLQSTPMSTLDSLYSVSGPTTICSQRLSQEIKGAQPHCLF